MKEAFWTAVTALVCLCALTVAKNAPPKVQVYSRFPEEIGKANVLICHVTGFHPPEISIKLRKNGVELRDSKQTDLAFEENWHYHLTKHADFIPNKGDKFECHVTHMNQTRKYTWDPDQ